MKRGTKPTFSVEAAYKEAVAKGEKKYTSAHPCPRCGAFARYIYTSLFTRCIACSIADVTSSQQRNNYQSRKKWLAKNPDYRKRWNEAHPNYHRDYARRWYAKKKKLQQAAKTAGEKE